MCNIYRDRTEHMTVDQVKKFVQQAKEAGGVQKVKVLGGEPLLNPNFEEIYKVLTDACKDGVIQMLKIDTNHTVQVPNVERFPFVRWMGMPSRLKRHIPFLKAPKDLGYTIGPQPRCQAISRCGWSLDKYGYQPCSSAIMLDRLFNNGTSYIREFPKATWGLENLCQYCDFAMPKEWRDKYSDIPILEHSKDDLTPSPIFKEVMDKFNHEEFYKKQQEF
jgi:hypothetical protein